MSNSNERRKQQLGMPYGTASNKLRKMLMFKFAQELGYDNCYACGLVIGSPEELSIEHIEPWEGRPHGTEKFWDLDNIAFSHLRCNVQHTKNKYGNRGGTFKQGEDGTAWCSSCQAFREVKHFQKASNRKSGYQAFCRECRKRR
jgi:hypothetical protein